MHATDWKLAGRAARLGALCALGPSLILFGWYFMANRHLPLPWLKIGVTSAAIGTFTGAAFGGVVRLLVAWFDRIAGRVANPVTAGVVGGALASIAAGVFAVAVFGSYRGPYVGTAEAATLLVASCWSLATLLTVEAMRGSRDLIAATGRVIVAAAATAAVTLAVALAIAPSLFCDGVFWTARAAIQSYGAVTVGVVLGIAVGAVFGLHLGLSIWLGRRSRTT